MDAHTLDAVRARTLPRVLPFGHRCGQTPRQMRETTPGHMGATSRYNAQRRNHSRTWHIYRSRGRSLCQTSLRHPDRRCTPCHNATHIRSWCSPHTSPTASAHTHPRPQALCHVPAAAPSSKAPPPAHGHTRPAPFASRLFSDPLNASTARPRPQRTCGSAPRPRPYCGLTVHRAAAPPRARFRELVPFHARTAAVHARPPHGGSCAPRREPPPAGEPVDSDHHEQAPPPGGNLRAVADGLVLGDLPASQEC